MRSTCFAVVFLVSLPSIPATACAEAPAETKVATAGPLSASDPAVNPVPNSVLEQISAISSEFEAAEKRGYFDLARQRLVDMLALFRQHFNEDHWIVRRVQSTLTWHEWLRRLTPDERVSYWESGPTLIAEAQAMWNQHRFTEAIGKIEEAAAILDNLKEPDFADRALVQIKLARARNFLDEPQRALEHAQKGCRIACASDGPISPLTAGALAQLGEVHGSLGDRYASAKALGKAIQIWTACAEGIAQDPKDSGQFAEALIWQAENLMSFEKYDKAARCLDECDSILKCRSEPLSETRYYLLKFRCKLLERTNHPTEADAKAAELPDVASQVFGKDSDEFNGARLIRAGTAFGAGKLEEADSISTSVFQDFRKDPRLPTYLCALGEVHAKVLIAQHQYIRAAYWLDSVFQACPDGKDDRLISLTALYAEALHRSERADDAKAADARVEAAKESLEEARRKFDADPDCRLPWEKPE